MSAGAEEFFDRDCQHRVELRVAHAHAKVRQERPAEARDHALVLRQILACLATGIAAQQDGGSGDARVMRELAISVRLDGDRELENRAFATPSTVHSKRIAARLFSLVNSGEVRIRQRIA